MESANCDAANRAAARFHSEWGARLAALCPSCGLRKYGVA